MKKILISIIIILAVVELYILNSSEPETNSSPPMPVIQKPQPIAPQSTDAPTQTISYEQMFIQEVVDESWASATEVQIFGTAKKLSTKFPSYFSKISTACKTAICKVAVTTESSNQPFPILVADFVQTMKNEGWLADISVLSEEVSGDTTSGKAIIYLINPTR